MKQKIAVIMFLWVYFMFTTTTSFLYFTKPRIRTVTIEIPGPAPSAPDSVVEITPEAHRKLQVELDTSMARLGRRIAAGSGSIQEAILVQATDADTAVGLKLYRSMKTFIHPTMYFGSVESYIEAIAPAAVDQFTNRIWFLEGESTIMDRLQKQWRVENPCPPGHFWTGFGYGGMTGFGMALGAVLLFGGIR